MHRGFVAGLMALTAAAAVTVHGQQPARTDAPSAARTFRMLDALPTQVVEQLEVQGRSVQEVLASPELRRSAAAQAAKTQGVRPGRPSPEVAVDMDALRARVGGEVKDVRIARDPKAAATSAPIDRVVTLRRGELLAVRRPGLAGGSIDGPGTPRRGGAARGPVGPVQPEAAAGTVSPTILYTVDDGGRLRELALIHRTAGLHWQPDRERFEGELLVGLLDRENPRASEPLGTSIPIQLVAEPGTIPLEQRDLSVDRIGVPLARVTVEVAAPDDPFQIAFLSSIDEDLPPAALPVTRPRLLLTAPAMLPGLGVGEAEVTVSALDGSLRPGQSITLALDNGWLSQYDVTVGETGTASTRIRSDWLGRGTLRVAAPAAYAADPRDIAYSIPFRFIIATLLGAMLGAYVLVYRLKRAEPAVGRSYASDWFAGVAVGAAATTMAYAGMKLPEWIPLPTALTGEAAPFALAFVCAAAGTSLIHVFTGPAQKAPPRRSEAPPL